MTVAGCLAFMPVSRILSFGRFRSKCVYLRSLWEPDRLNELPGGVKITVTQSNGVYSKKITFQTSDLTPEMIDLLSSYRGERFVMTYSDERSRQRVCGSPEYPLALEFTENGGCLNVVITGNSPYPDLFL